LLARLFGIAELCLGRTAARPLSISGGVQDPSGAIVGANDRTEAVAHTSTNGSGGFQFRNLTSGSYVIDVKQTGFRETKVSAVAGNETRSPLRIVMAVAAQEEQITVGSTLNLRGECN